MTGKDSYEGTREEMERAILRLHLLEYAILFVVVILALVGGGLAAYILSAATELPFRLTWGLVSLLLLLVPGLIVLGRDRRRRARTRAAPKTDLDNG